MTRRASWAPSSMVFGADYNPEQWDESVWVDDVALMREARVNLVSLAIFSWALLEPEPGRFDFRWLDRAMDRLADGGIGVNLANATASPPPWLAHRHPETLPVDVDGRTLWTGARQAYCPSSPVFRERSARMSEAIATHYREHPALRMWHVGNEFGCHVTRCYCDVSAVAFRRWLETRYGTLDELNRAWSTNFWSQRYHRWEEINPPRRAPTFNNPTQEIDFRRFSSDELLACYRSDRTVLARITPDVPITTNLLPAYRSALDYWMWVDHVDVVAMDHYLDAADPLAHLGLAFTADIARGLANGEPWLIMEHSTSAVNWQHRNRPKAPGELQRNSMQHVARGSDGAMFFQWRQSRAGAEKYHSAMVPHAGTETRVWREVTELGRALERLDAVVGSRVAADVAMIYDYQSLWVNDLRSRPSSDVHYVDQPQSMHRALWDAGITCDVVQAGAPLDRYRLLLVPTVTMLTDAAAAEIARFVEAGGHAVVTYFSGIVDEHDHVRLGGYPGAFRELLGVLVEEFHPLRRDEVVTLSNGATATLWAEDLATTGATPTASYADGPLAGRPAITRHEFGAGVAWYVATRLEQPDLATLLAEVTSAAGVEPVLAGLPPGVEAVRRVAHDGQSFVFVINHTNTPAELPNAAHDLLTNATIQEVPAGGTAVLRM